MSSVNRQEFEQLMDAGHNAAWDQNWALAIEEYGRAAGMMPEDAEVHVNLGLALMHSGQYDRALRAFRKAIQIEPGDPVPQERSADVLERMGQLRESAQQYVRVAELYLAQRDLGKAVENWKRATHLTPGLVSVHAKLAKAFARMGDTKRTVREYLILAFNFKRMGDTTRAIKAVEQALKYDPKHTQALNTLSSLKAGGEVVLPEEVLEDISNQGSARPETYFSELERLEEEEDIEANPLGPVGEAMDLALEMLAAHVVEAGLSPYVMPALRAMESHRQGEDQDAIEYYLEADQAGLHQPALRMCLGGLLILNDEAEQALPHLQNAAAEPDLFAGAYHGMGLAHYLKGEHSVASRCLIESLQAADKSRVRDQAEINELSNVYEKLIQALAGRTEDSLIKVNERFIGLLSGDDWKQRIAEIRRHLDETLRGEGGTGVVDFLTARGGDDLAEAVTMIDRFIRNGLYTVAMDEAHRAIEISPYYLPIHVRMAEVMMKEGRIRQAINKYNAVARTYLVREEHERAASILAEVLEMAPLDVDVRMSLIDLLESQSRTEEALEQRVNLATTYQQLGDFDKAGQVFNEAERIARQIDTPDELMVRIKHHIAEIAQMRLNTRQAQKIYEDILEIMPQDEQSLRSLIDIYLTQGNSVEAVKKLDVLMGVYARTGMVTRIVQVLQELVRMNPDETSLRARLASIYKKLGRKAEAIEQLDALGELQLEAGLTKEAAGTIRQIIAIGPDRVEDYKRLLQQLNS